MSYQFKYLKYLQDDEERGTQKMVQVLDQKLFELQERKGEYHAQTVEFMTGIRLFAAGAPTEAAHQLAVLVAKYMMATLVNKTGSVASAQKLKEELMEDATKVGDALLAVIDDEGDKE